MRGTPPTENYRKKSHYETTNAWAGTLALIIFERLWVRIPAPYTRWTFFHIDFLYKLYCLFEKTKNKKNEKEAGVGPFLKTTDSNIFVSTNFNEL